MSTMADYNKYSDEIEAYLTGNSPGSAASAVGAAAVKSAPTIMSDANPFLKYGASIASVGGNALSAFINMRQAEEQQRLAEEDLKLKKRAQALSEKQYNDGSTQRGVDLTTSAYGAANTAQGWRDRIRAIVRGR